MAASPEVETVRRPGEAGFVGRARELAGFGEAFERMLGGRRQIVTLAGEPGIGKTRLAEAMAEAAEERGALVLWGRCYEEPGAPPYWPWVQILRELIEALSPSELSLLAGSGGPQLSALVPELARALELPPVGDSMPLEPSQARFMLMDAVGGFLKRAAARVPIVLLIDNAHWADKASLGLLEFLSQELAHSRMLIAFTYRDTEITRNNPLLATLGALGSGDGVTRLRLRGLDQTLIRQLADAILGRRLPDHVICAIDEQTDGNPLFVIELLKVLIEESRDAGVEPIAVRIPDGVRETIGRRLSRLPRTSNDLLRAASVIGREFEAAVLASVADGVIGDVIVALDLAESAGFVEVTDRAGQAYRFTHALIRETLYDELSTPERLRLHGLAGDALVALNGNQPTSHLSRIAHHYVESAALGHASQAAEYAMRAGRNAMRLDAYDEAAVHFGQAIRLQRQHGGGGPELLRAAILCQIRSLIAIGNDADAVSLTSEVLDDPVLAEDPEWLTDMLLQWMVMTSFVMQAERLPLLQRIIERLPPGDSSARAKALAGHALAEATLGITAQTRSRIYESVAMARRLGDPAVLNHCLRSALMALASDPTQIEARLAFGNEFIAHSPAGDHSGGKAEALYQQVCNLIEAGRIGDVDSLIEDLSTLSAVQFGFQEYRAAALPVVVALLRGEYAGLEPKIERLREIGHKTRGEDADGVYGVQMFMLNRDLGRLPALKPMIERLAGSPVFRTWTPGLVLALTEIGRPDLATRELDKLAAGDFAAIPFDAIRASSLAYCAEACTALGNAEIAKQLYSLLLPYSSTFVCLHLAFCFGSAERYLGMLAATMGELDLAIQHYEAAIRSNTAGQAWPWLARTFQQYALALRRGGEARQAAQADRLLREAEQLAGSLGMDGLAAEVHSLLRGERPGDAYPDDLTAREVEVLRLIVIGRSNKDVAKVLSISLNTVATHVRNILTKTDCANRTEAAAYARRNGIVESDSRD